MTLTHGEQAVKVAKREFNKLYNLPESSGPERWTTNQATLWYLYLGGFLAGAQFQLEVDASSLDSIFAATADRDSLKEAKALYLHE
jgi:hypothetical protein